MLGLTFFLNCAVVLVCIYSGTEARARIFSNDPSPSRIVTTTIEVVNEIPPTQLCVSCWSASGEQNQRRCYGGDNSVGSFSWDFEPTLNTVFWCSGQWGEAYIDSFAVYGGSASRQSSTWLFDARGKRRIISNDKPVNDHIEPWTGLLPTTTTTTSTTTTTPPTTTTKRTTTTTPTTTTTRTTTTTTTPTTTTTTPTTTTTSTTTTTTTPTTTTTRTTTTTPTTTTPTTTTTTPTTTTTRTTTTTPTTTTPTTTTTPNTTTTRPTTTTTRITSTTTEATTHPSYDFECPAPEGNFADPEDCSGFYSCTDGIVIGHQYCPDGLYFNPAINNCDFAWNVDCDINTTRGNR